MTELRRVITAKFPRHVPGILKYEKLLKRYAIWVKLGSQTVSVSRDPDDDKFIEAALLGGCTYVVSGDNDLLDLKSYRGIKFVTPSNY